MTEPLEIIAAFVDGERVDPNALKQALGTAEGRDYLVDLAALRELVDRETTVLVTAPPRQRRLLSWVGAAAAVAVLATGSYFLGQRSATAERHVSDGPVATTTDTPPAPTRVIQLEPGVNWTESSGGR